MFRHKAKRASLGIHGPDREFYKSLLWTDLRGQRLKLDRTTWAASSRPHQNGTRRLTLEHDRVGAGSMADRGYVQEQLATQCGTCMKADLSLQLWPNLVQRQKRDLDVTSHRLNIRISAAKGSS